MLQVKRDVFENRVRQSQMNKSALLCLIGSRLRNDNSAFPR
jgi:hypothetical protein